MKVILIHSRDDADNGKRIVKRFEENVSEKIDGVGQDVRILTDEDYFVLKHNECQQFQEGIKGEHADNGEDPLFSKESIGLLC